ncbi:FimB/Mfa2 family fimbrial subunit [Bacteroides hominis]|uniref:FimB/Mfa2 family fimbrial subunit n=1 Tax=Bacteroides hominis TaxID=2763023 RepID=UPI00164BFFDF|nr:FimB/Mfa2 family fimbrial subunit [Bacteroides hominis (ex Liu et al. 2022)]MBC5614549.1 FimB/Mfa2 family fimbrial subunit [Bacteroides hominis (ex Liu et al. 2022)]
MKKNPLFYLWAALLFTSCDVKDPIYNTPHPEHGKITLTADWSARGAGIDIPATYTVQAGDYSATLSDATATLDHLFAPGTYHTYIYSTPEHITVSGTTATVGTASGTWDGVGAFVHAAPGWLFTCATDAVIEKDTEHALTAAMQQQVRQLTLIVEPTGGTTGRIEAIEGYLSGVASTFDMNGGTHGTPANVALTFTKLTDGADAGKWSATVRLLGTAGSAQQLTAEIRFSGNNPRPVTLTSDLTTELAAFNTDKTKPLTLGGKVVETPTEAGFTATITDWEQVTGDGPVYAD